MGDRVRLARRQRGSGSTGEARVDGQAETGDVVTLEAGQLLSEIGRMGFDEIHLHDVGRNQTEFIEVFGAEVLPALQFDA